MKILKIRFKKIAALALAVSLGTGFTAVYAAAPADKSAANNPVKIEGKIKGNRWHGARSVYAVLENKLGYSEAQIDEAAKSGKTAFDLAKQKGVSESQLKAMIVDAQSQKIDGLVSKGKLTKDEAASMKTKLKAKIQSWNGSIMPGRHGMNPASSVLQDKLGFTKAQIDEAAKAHKTAFDLAKQKGVTADQLRAMIVEAKSNKIDKMVSEGKIPKDKADTMKAKLKTRIQTWDGCLDCSGFKNKGK